VSGAHDHPEIDRPASALEAAGFLERRDARAKIVAALALVLAAVLVKEERNRLLLLALPVLAFASLGKTPLPRVLARASVVLPFALLASVFLPFVSGSHVVFEWNLGPVRLHATEEGFARLVSVVARASLSAVALASLALSTDLSDLVRGLSGLGVPRVLAITMSFTLRYLSLLRDEARRLALARELRTFGWHPRLALRSMGHAAGTLFVRTFERAERVHAAMATRGFDGSIPSLSPPRFGLADLVLALVAAGLAVAIALVPI